MKPSSKNEIINAITEMYVTALEWSKDDNFDLNNATLEGLQDWKFFNGEKNGPYAEMWGEASERNTLATTQGMLEITMKVCNARYNDGRNIFPCIITFEDGSKHTCLGVSLGGKRYYDETTNPTEFYMITMDDIGAVSCRKLKWEVDEDYNLIESSITLEKIESDTTSSEILNLLNSLDSAYKIAGNDGAGGGIDPSKPLTLNSTLDVEGKGTFGSDLEVDGKLQVNTATDIVTKDGTSIGGGIPLLVPIEKKIDESESYIILNQADVIANKIFAIDLTNEFGTYFLFNSIQGSPKLYFDGIYIEFIYDSDYNEEGKIKYILRITNGNGVAVIPSSKQVGSEYYFSIDSIKDSNYIVGLDTGSAIFCMTGTAIMPIFENNDNFYSFKIKGLDETNKYERFEVTQINFALKSDLPNVWAQYRHTVTITGTDFAVCFTTLSSKNTPVDSLQDLITLFASTKLACTGDAYRIDIGATSTAINFISKTGSKAISTVASLKVEDDVTQD